MFIINIAIVIDTKSAKSKKSKRIRPCLQFEDRVFVMLKIFSPLDKSSNPSIIENAVEQMFEIKSEKTAREKK